uniref:Putative secreted protein n=1 Tax=Panstrongylus lignarius TaxID=156445 RepID=A0A224XSN6_9HEMI
MVESRMLRLYRHLIPGLVLLDLLHFTHLLKLQGPLKIKTYFYVAVNYMCHQQIVGINRKNCLMEKLFGILGQIKIRSTAMN